MPAPPVTIYVTSLTSMPKVRRHIDLLHRALGGLEIPYETFDLAVDEDAKRRWQRAKPAQPVVGLPGYLVGGEWIGTMDDFEAAVEEQRLESFLKQDVDHADPNQSIGDAEIERLMKEMSDKDLDQLAGNLGGTGGQSGKSVGAGATAGLAAGAAAVGTAAVAAGHKVKESVAPKSAETAGAKDKATEVGRSPLQPPKEKTDTEDKSKAPSSKLAADVTPSLSKPETPAEPAPTPCDNIEDPTLAALVAEGTSRAHTRTPTEEMQGRAAAIAAADAALRDMEDEDDYAAPESSTPARGHSSKGSKSIIREPAPLRPKDKKSVATEKPCTPISTENPTEADIKRAAEEAASRAAVRAEVESGANTPVPCDKLDTLLGRAGAALSSAAGSVTHAAGSAVSAIGEVPKAAAEFANEATGVNAVNKASEPKVDGPKPGEKTLDEVIDSTMEKERKEAK